MGGNYKSLITNNISKIQRNFNFKIISKVDGCIVLSKSLINNFQNIVEEKKIYIVSNGIDDDFLISDTEFNEKLNISNNKESLNVLYLSNFIETKGYRKVLELATIEKQRCRKFNTKKIHFDFAGNFFNEEEKRYFFNYIEENSLEDYITYHGVVKGIQKRELLKNSDIFILLTNYPNEGQPISILEAMGNGLFILTTNHAGIPDIVKSDVNGILFDLNDNIEYIYESLLNLCDFNKRVDVMIKNREEGKKKYSEESYIDNMKKVIDEILNN